MPEMPTPALTLAEIDQALNRPDVRPPGCEWRPLDPGSYALKLPGFPEAIRVTTSAEVFEDLSDSHEFLSPGGRVFETLAPEALPDHSEDGKGHVWIRESSREVVAATEGGDRKVSTLQDLLEVTGQIGTAKTPEGAQEEGGMHCLG